MPAHGSGTALHCTYAPLSSQILLSPHGVVVGERAPQRSSQLITSGFAGSHSFVASPSHESLVTVMATDSGARSAPSRTGSASVSVPTGARSACTDTHSV